jgi:hypothetical protein
MAFSWDGKTIYHSTGLDDMHRFSLSSSLSISPAGVMTGLYQGHQHSRGHATDPQGNLYVAHHREHRSGLHDPYEVVVSKLSPSGSMVRSQFIHHVERSLSGGLKVDKQGNIYIGIRVKPSGQEYPGNLAGKISGTGAAGDLLYWAKEMYGSLIKYSNSGSKLWEYFGISPTTRHGIYPVSGPGCLCNVTRFDVDQFGRIFVSDAYQYSIIILDNNRNEILRYKYSDLVMDGRIPVAWIHQIEEANGMLYTADQFNNLVCGLHLESAEPFPLSIDRGEERDRQKFPLLLENLPNPFCSETTIRFNCGLSIVDCGMQIFDINGKLVEDFSGKIRNPQFAIHSQIVWNTRTMKPGVYFCRLKTGNKTIERKLILVR